MTAAFLSGLAVNILDDDNAELTADFVFRSEYLKHMGLLRDGLVVVPRGFVTDFASVPRVPGAYWLVGGRAKWEATIHDYLYRELHLGRKVADEVFLEAMRVKRRVVVNGKEEERAQPAWVRGLMWGGVRAFGWWSYRGEDTPEAAPEPDPYESMKGE